MQRIVRPIGCFSKTWLLKDVSEKKGCYLHRHMSKNVFGHVWPMVPPCDPKLDDLDDVLHEGP